MELTDCLPSGGRPTSRTGSVPVPQAYACPTGCRANSTTPSSPSAGHPRHIYSRAMVYFDAASGEPISAVAKAALLAALDDGWADPARLHREGRRAGLLLDQAREQVAGVLGCRADEVAFTSSGTHAAQLAVLGAVLGRQTATRGPGHVVTSAVEHSSVLNAAAQAEGSGSPVTIVGVEPDGRVDVAAFGSAVKQDRTVLAC